MFVNAMVIFKCTRQSFSTITRWKFDSIWAWHFLLANKYSVLKLIFVLFLFCNQYYDEPPVYRAVLDMFNTIFTFMFTGEAILKLFAFRTVSPHTEHY